MHAELNSLVLVSAGKHETQRQAQKHATLYSIDCLLNCRLACLLPMGLNREKVIPGSPKASQNDAQSMPRDTEYSNFRKTVNLKKTILFTRF
jgi:hypothetical protein